MPVVFGEVDAVQKIDPSLLFDDKFESGPCGWQQLLSGGYSAPYGSNSPVGALGLVTWPAMNGGFALEFHSEDAADTGSPMGEGTAIKRLTRPTPLGVVAYDYWFAYDTLHYAASTPRAIDFGMDQADASGNRHFFKYRLWTNDSGNKWQIASGTTGSTVFTDIPSSANLIAAINENKSGWNRITLYFDLVNMVYVGLVVNGNAFGTYVGGAALPSAAGVNTPIDAGVLSSFANGMNAGIEIRNRTDTGSSKTWCYLGRARGFLA